ncbi:MAG: Ig-like domain-containing protein [Muribaculaceae bacterium]|nr:Ig-like domain-containing protein [Muribaculaceae bacterium]
MKTINIFKKSAVIAAMCAMALPVFAQENTETPAKEITGWGDFKLFLDPGHSMRENRGLWGYSEAEKVFAISQTIKEYLTTYTDMPAENLMLCREDEVTEVGLEERSDMANAWGADFYYSIHSDASADNNTTVTLFGGWMKNGVEVEKTPNGGKAFGEILCPNLTDMMMDFACTGTRGNWYDRCFYMRGETTHANQYPYLSVNRRSNMASLLSEGAYHTIAAQQQLNINVEYKRLEALAAFQSILKYRGLQVPSQSFLAGIIRNSENSTPINGVKVTVDGKTYTTDTWESVFNKYTKNENLIHNGFYFFEGLTIGQTYDVTFECDGFETKTVQVTIKDGQQGATKDFVTVQHIEMTSTSPAKVDAISVEDATNVSPLYPVTITFSRNMDKESVEKAITINNGGEISFSWVNDYTLNLDITKLDPMWTYDITIDGSIAKNSQTNQFFDGDGDGVEGGNYVLSITIAEPDVVAPQVTTTYPAADATAEFAQMPPIRIEYDEEIIWNSDKHAECITLKDSDGKVYEGTTTHAVVAGKSVVHFYTNDTIPADKCFLVSVKAGLPDMSGNETEEFYFRFLSEYRTKTSSTVLFPLTSADGFWAPNGSGSTSGLTDEGNSTTSSTLAPNKNTAGSALMTYSFDEYFANEVWQIREYTPTQSGVNANRNISDGILTFWLYGDGSNNAISAMLRINNSELKHQDPQTTINFRGWNLIKWDIKNEPFAHFTGESTTISTWRFDSFFMKHEWTDIDDEETPFQAWSGAVNFNNLEFSQWSDASQTAKPEDIEIPVVGVESIVEEAPIKVACNGTVLNISAANNIALVNIYNAAGAVVLSNKPSSNNAIISVANLADGVYFAQVTTEGNTKTVKFIK